MAASILIYEPNEARFESFSLDQLSELESLKLSTLEAFDFIAFAQESDTAWTEGEPIKADEEQGMILSKINEQGIKQVCSYQGELEASQKEDLEKLKNFVDQHGTDHIYELSTFEM